MVPKPNFLRSSAQVGGGDVKFTTSSKTRPSVLDVQCSRYPKTGPKRVNAVLAGPGLCLWWPRELRRRMFAPQEARGYQY